MEERKRNPSRHFFRLIGALFVVYIALYIAMESGYYETKLGEKVTLTNERIKEFEQDVKDGKEIDVNDYLEDEMIDYSNNISKAGMNISNSTEKFMTSGIQKIFKFIGSLFS